jgi:hypothetical protein
VTIDAGSCVLQVGSGRTIPVVKDAQVGSGRTIPVVREVVRGLTLGERALNSWVFVGDVKEEFILGLGTPRAYPAGLPRGLTPRQWTWDAMRYDRPE